MKHPYLAVVRIDGTDRRAAGIHMKGHVEVFPRFGGVMVRLGRYGSPRARVVMALPWVSRG